MQLLQKFHRLRLYFTRLRLITYCQLIIHIQSKPVQPH